ncbi:SRPBCC domain-containing protein [Paenibacillus solisilvae]|uniref:SRPBCC domain-containing protein n=1 Tax=Paenibacillus solisilvae TaxID=2486751 RepID=A0ABW0W5K9_9BACL
MTQKNEAGNITTTVRERDFTMERIFDAPRELVFQTFSKPEHISRWWAPRPYTIPVCNIDFRPGGVWHYCMRSPEGEVHWARSVYQEITEPEQIVFTTTFADQDANPTDEVPLQRATVTLTEYEGKTKVNLRYQFESDEDLQVTVAMGIVEGITATFGNLEQLLQEI